MRWFTLFAPKNYFNVLEQIEFTSLEMLAGVV